jgi:hypothetical protein
MLGASHGPTRSHALAFRLMDGWQAALLAASRLTLAFNVWAAFLGHPFKRGGRRSEWEAIVPLMVETGLPPLLLRGAMQWARHARRMGLSAAYGARRCVFLGRMAPKHRPVRSAFYGLDAGGKGDDHLGAAKHQSAITGQSRTSGSAQQRPGALQSQLRGDCASQADQRPPPPQSERRFADAHSRSRARVALF